MGVSVGTCGYDYPGWKGAFYPPELKREEFLEYYAGQFGALEIHYTFHRIPEPGWARSVAERSGADLLFSVKAHESLTHKIVPSQWTDSAEGLKAAIEPLMSAGRLVAVLFQFPHSFGYDPDRRRYLGRLLTAFRSFPRVVEFRNPAWINNRVIDTFREQGTAFGCTDTPALPELPPPMDAITADFAYVRLHGRNAAAWWNAGDGSRYDYLYSEDELKFWIYRIEAMTERARQVFVFFNNVPGAGAPRNARMMMHLLQRSAA